MPGSKIFRMEGIFQPPVLLGYQGKVQGWGLCSKLGDKVNSIKIRNLPKEKLLDSIFYPRRGSMDNENSAESRNKPRASCPSVGSKIPEIFHFHP